MSIWKKTKTSDGKSKTEIDVRQLRLRLQSIAYSCNIEVMQLALQSMLEEIEEVRK